MQSIIQNIQTQRRKLQEFNELKNDNGAKERRINDLEKKLKQQTQSLQEELNIQMREKTQHKEKSEKYKAELIELQEKYQQLFYSSRVPQAQPNTGRRQTVLSNHTQEDACTPGAIKRSSHRDKADDVSDSKVRVSFQGIESVPSQPSNQKIQPAKNMRRATNRKIPAVTKDGIEQIATEIRYKLRSANIRSSEIELFLFQDENKELGETPITDLIHTLQQQLMKILMIVQRKPFFVGENESVKLARYLIEPQGEKEVIYNISLYKQMIYLLSRTNNNEQILHLFKHVVGQYQLLIGEEKIIMHNQIRKELHAKKEQILEVLKGKQSNDLTENLFTRQSFIVALLQTSLEEEQKDVFLQTIFDLTNDFNLIDLEIVWHHWPAEGPVLIQRAPKPEDQNYDKDGHREGITNSNFRVCRAPHNSGMYRQNVGLCRKKSFFNS